MQKYLSVPEVEGVPALCAPSDAERDLARLHAAQGRRAAIHTTGDLPARGRTGVIRKLLARLRSRH